MQLEANQHLLLQPWILAERIGSILISGHGNLFNMTLDVSCYYMTCNHGHVMTCNDHVITCIT